MQYEICIALPASQPVAVPKVMHHDIYAYEAIHYEKVGCIGLVQTYQLYKSICVAKMSLQNCRDTSSSGRSFMDNFDMSTQCPYRWSHGCQLVSLLMIKWEHCAPSLGYLQILYGNLWTFNTPRPPSGAFPSFGCEAQLSWHRRQRRQIAILRTAPCRVAGLCGSSNLHWTQERRQRHRDCPLRRSWKSRTYLLGLLPR